MLTPWRLAWKWYLQKLSKHQILTNMASTGTIFLLGDVISQQFVEHKREAHDWNRTLRSIGLGSFYIAPIVTGCYNVLDKVFGKGQTPRVVFRKMACMAVFSPFMSAGYLTLNNVLNGNGKDVIIHQLRYDLPTIQLTNWSIWLPTHYLLFTFAPMKHRMFLSNIVGVAWTTYLTYKADRRGYILEELEKVLEKEGCVESDQVNKTFSIKHE